MAEFARRLARGAGRRLVVLGVVALIAGVFFYGYGRKLNAEQAGASVRASFPDQLELVGAIAGALGVLFVVLGAIKLARARRAELPVAQAID